MGHYAAEMGDYSDYLNSSEYREAIKRDAMHKQIISAIAMESLGPRKESSFGQIDQTITKEQQEENRMLALESRKLQISLGATEAKVRRLIDLGEGIIANSFHHAMDDCGCPFCSAVAAWRKEVGT